ncbi:MAG: hypothetical protein HZT40_15990 [Candidatus Thiothrix singaporensis]|uniref:Uncharacterized protein n=1 Tax=Candidatus Thiothrix singaporensis TaxID=2799669 RepID=A0A7L6AUP0_9GAMM|nr:MAG: hypothetical protein HZT40_15990 [Candidatus Thiothrix singaporensis]
MSPKICANAARVAAAADSRLKVRGASKTFWTNSRLTNSKSSASGAKALLWLTRATLPRFTPRPSSSTSRCGQSCR